MRERWPNPAAIVYPTGGPPKRVAYLTTRSVARAYPLHDHTAFVTKAGDGVTDTVASHFHRVVGGRILPAEDGHTHRMTNLPAGAG